ncbi:NYN domain-containing protein [Salinibacterium sp. NG253]|uniref:NYN domain-containing protein n=1 Tax=Salinibacterium sp. NG253 TaxID=2792039 RepID=UPI0018CD8550|nr:NYN domain-containing protein [Salinibacterium sp. NG253]MBH0115307.1 NYN domain-containing protein [Salinibacterium sp. NG253]
MATATEGRVAVYIDFDNIVISRYNQIHGKGQFSKDKARNHSWDPSTPTAVGAKLKEAEVDVEAILDYASSFGTVAFSRAYADWSAPVNAAYQEQLVNRAVDLVQLFPLTAQLKNGADIRLSVDAMEDMFRLPDITHVVIVAGDSDYVALAQRAKTLGRFVVGIGVAGGTSKALTASCDKFADYDSLLGVAIDPPPLQTSGIVAAVIPPKKAAKATALQVTTAAASAASSPSATPATKKSPPSTPAKSSPQTKTSAAAKKTKSTAVESPTNAMRPFKLLVRAMRLVQQKEDSDWLNSSAVKNQMLRIDPSFDEAALKFEKFSDFVTSHQSSVEMQEREGVRQIRLRANATLPK